MDGIGMLTGQEWGSEEPGLVEILCPWQGLKLDGNHSMILCHILEVAAPFPELSKNFSPSGTGVFTQGSCYSLHIPAKGTQGLLLGGFGCQNL